MGLAIVLALAVSVGDLLGQVHSAETTYYAAMPAAAKDAGSPQVMDYYLRLFDAETLLNSLKEPLPSGYSADQFRQYAVSVADMDLDVVRQLMQRKYTPVTAQPGLREVFLRSSADGTMQPSALYVPQSYKPGVATPVVVFLHGHDQTESELLSPFYIRELADSTGSIVIAPYGRANYDFRGAAVSDVYDALAAVQRVFSVDHRRIFLTGYSMGGFSVFEVAPAQPMTWRAVMCISGGLLNEDIRHVMATMRQVPIYVVTGSKDDAVDTAYTTATAEFIAGFDELVSYYSVDGGTHRIVTLLPRLRQAWSDMHAGTVRQAPEGFARYSLPRSPSMPVVKP